MWRALAKTGGTVAVGMLAWWGMVASSCDPYEAACANAGWFALRMNLYDTLFLGAAVASLAALSVAVHRNTH